MGLLIFQNISENLQNTGFSMPHTSLPSLSPSAKNLSLRMPVCHIRQITLLPTCYGRIVADCKLDGARSLQFLAVNARSARCAV